MVRRAREEPGLAVQVLLELARGYYYRVKFRLLGRRVVIGKFFRVKGPLDIRGPGTVIFGNRCRVESTRIRPTTPYTHAPDGVIQFGDRVLLTRTRIGCHVRIEVGEGSGISEATITDSDFHAVQAGSEPQYNTAGRSKAVIIGSNVWIGQGAAVLKGVRIGDGAIVGAFAVVAYSVPPYAVVFGNPARVVWRTRRPPPADAGVARGTPGD